MAYDITARLNVVLNQGDLTRITKQLNQVTSPTSNKPIGINVDTSSLVSANRHITEAKNNMTAFGEQSGLAARRFGAFSLAAGGFIALSQGIRGALTEAISFDREMVRLKQVSNDVSSGGVNEVRQEIDKLSTSLGVSSSELARVAVILKQANLSLGETKVALEALALTALAPNFDSMAKTAEGAIAVLKQFKIPVTDLVGALGSINAVAGEFAVEASDLISVIQRTGGAFKAAGGNLNELLAAFTSVRQTTRESAESIATGLRTIFTRIQRTETADALRSVGVNLRYTADEARALGSIDLVGQFVGASEAIKRLSVALNQIPTSDPKFAQLIEEIGGYRQISKVIPLIQEFAVNQQALNVAIRGGASLMESAAIAQGSFGNRMDKITQSFLLMGRTFTDSSAFKTIFTMFEMGAQSALVLLEALKPLLPLLTSMATVSIVKSVGSFGAGFGTTFAGKPAKKSEGGPIGFKNGGIVPGHGSGDIVPAMLEPGERVIPKRFAAGGHIDESKLNNPEGFKSFMQGSKTINSQTGKYKKFFHGTKGDNFNTFNNSKTGGNFYGKAHYFTEDPDAASSYSGQDTIRNVGSRVLPTTLQMKNPYLWDPNKSVDDLVSSGESLKTRNGKLDRGKWNEKIKMGAFPEDISEDTLKHADKIFARFPKIAKDFNLMENREKRKFFSHVSSKALQKQGYDSINIGSDYSAVFKSNQIKSLYNTGKWDSQNTDIMKNLGGAIHRQKFENAGPVYQNVNMSGIKNPKRFEEEFKDSKFRDEETGEHKVAFHGTKNNFDTFANNKTKRNMFGKGFYHASDRKIAEDYTGKSGQVMSNALNMKNPFTWDSDQAVFGMGMHFGRFPRNKLNSRGQIDESDWRAAEEEKLLPAALSAQSFAKANKILDRSPKLRAKWESMSYVDKANFFAHVATKSLQKMGHDSINVPYGEEFADKKKGGNSAMSIVFKSNQIKSLHGNDGSWNSKDPNINKALGGSIQRQRFSEGREVTKKAGAIEKTLISAGTGVHHKKRDKDDFVKGKVLNDSDNVKYTITSMQFDDPRSANISDIPKKGAAFENAFFDEFRKKNPKLKKTIGNYPVDFFAGEQVFELKNEQKDVSEPKLLSKLIRHRKAIKDNFLSNTSNENEDLNLGELKVVYNSSNAKNDKIKTQRSTYTKVEDEHINAPIAAQEKRLNSEDLEEKNEAGLKQYSMKQAGLIGQKQRSKNRREYRLYDRSDSYQPTDPEIKKIHKMRSQLAALKAAKAAKAANGGFIVPGVGNTDSVPMDLASGSYVIRKSSTQKLGFAEGGIVPALLTPGEAVFNPETAAKIGSPALERMNKFGKFASGGRVGFTLGGGGNGGPPFYGFPSQDSMGDKKLSEEKEKMVAEIARWLMLTGISSDYTDAVNKALKQVESSATALSEAQKLAAESAADPTNVGLAAQSAAATSRAQIQAGITNSARDQNAQAVDHVSGQVLGETSGYLQNLRIDPKTAMKGSGLPGTERGVSIGSATKDLATTKIASEEFRIKSELIEKIKQQILTIDSSISTENAAEMANKEFARVRSGQSKVLFNTKGESIGTSGFGDVLTGMGQNPEGKSQKSSAVANFLGFGSAGAGASPEERAAQKQSNMMQRTMLMSGASSYGMEFVNSQVGKIAGTSATEAVQLGKEGTFATGQAVSGGVTGATTGALMAASLGLSGPLVGLTAVAIGLYAAFSSLKEAAIALAKAEQEKQEIKTKEFLKATIEGQQKGNSLELNQNLSDLKNTMLTTAKAEAGWFDTEKDTLSKTNKSMEKFLAENNQQIAKSSSMGIKESIIGAGPIKDVEKFVQELIKANPAIRENIAMSRKAGETLAQATENIKKDAMRMAKEANNVEPLKKFNQGLQLQAMALKTFSDAINVALVRMTFLSSSFDLLTEVLDNPIRSIGMSGLNKNAQIISSPEGFSKQEFMGALQATFSQFGQFGQQSIKEFAPLAEIGQLLPNFIARSVQDQNPPQRLEELLRNQFGANDQATNNIIGSIMAQVNRNDKFGDEGKQDPSKMAEELLAPFMKPLAEYGKKINSLQTEFANKFSASLAKLNSAELKYIADIEKTYSMREDLSRMDRSASNLLGTGADQNVADPKRAMQLFEESQNRLLSNGRKMAGGANVPNDITSIKDQLINSINAQSAAQVKMDTAKDPATSTAAMNEFAQAGKDIHVFRTALENFVSKSGQLIAEFDKQIGELVSQRGAGIDAIKKYAMSDPQSKMQFHQGQNLFNMLDKGQMNPAMAVNNPEILKSMYSFADSMGDFKIFKDSQGNDVTAKQSLDTQLFLPILKQMRPDLGDDKLQAMLNGRRSIQEKALAAQEALSDVSKELIRAIRIDLIRSQIELTNQMFILNNTLQLNLAKQQQLELEREKGELVKIQKQAQESGLAGLNLDAGQQKDFVKYTGDQNFVKYLEQQQQAANIEGKMGLDKKDIMDVKDDSLKQSAFRWDTENNKIVKRLQGAAEAIDQNVGGRIIGNETPEQIEEKVRNVSASTGMNEEKSRYAIKKSMEDRNEGSIGTAIVRDIVKNRDVKGVKINKDQQDFYDKNIAKHIKTLEIKSAVEAANSLQKLGITAGGVAASLGKLVNSLMVANQLVAAHQAQIANVPPPAQGGLNIKSGGGFISAQGLASGGPVYRREGGDSGDNIPAMLTAGEFVMNKGSVSKYGKKFMSDLNNGNVSSNNNEGGVQGLQEGGMPKTIYASKGTDVALQRDALLGHVPKIPTRVVTNPDFKIHQDTFGNRPSQEQLRNIMSGTPSAPRSAQQQMLDLVNNWSEKAYKDGMTTRLPNPKANPGQGGANLKPLTATPTGVPKVSATPVQPITTATGVPPEVKVVPGVKSIGVSKVPATPVQPITTATGVPNQVPKTAAQVQIKAKVEAVSNAVKSIGVPEVPMAYTGPDGKFLPEGHPNIVSERPAYTNRNEKGQFTPKEKPAVPTGKKTGVPPVQPNKTAAGVPNAAKDAIVKLPSIGGPNAANSLNPSIPNPVKVGLPKPLNPSIPNPVVAVAGGAALINGIFSAGNGDANPTTKQWTQGLNNFLNLGAENEKPSNAYFDVNAAGTSILQATAGLIGNALMLPVTIGEIIGNASYGTGTWQQAGEQAYTGVTNTASAIGTAIADPINNANQLGFLDTLKAATGLGTIDFGGQAKPRATIGENISAGRDSIIAGVNNSATSFQNEITNPNMPLAIGETAAGYMNMAVGVQEQKKTIDDSRPPFIDTKGFKTSADYAKAYKRIETFYRNQAASNWENASRPESLIRNSTGPLGILASRGDRLRREAILQAANEYVSYQHVENDWKGDKQTLTGEKAHDARTTMLIEKTSRDWGITDGFDRMLQEEDPAFQEAKKQEEERKSAKIIKDQEDAKTADDVRIADSAQADIDQAQHSIKLGEMDVESEYQRKVEADKSKAARNAVTPPRTPEQTAKFYEDRAAQEEIDRGVTNARNAKLDAKDRASGRKQTREESLRDKIRFDFNGPFSQWSHLNSYLLRYPMEYTDNAMDGISKYDFQAAVSVKDIWQDYVREESGTSLMGGRQQEWANLSGGDGQIISEELKNAQKNNKISHVLSEDYNKKINMDKTFSFMNRNFWQASDSIDKNMDLSGLATLHLLNSAYGDNDDRMIDIRKDILDVSRGGAYPELFREKHYNKDIAQKFSKAGLMRIMSEQQKKPADDKLGGFHTIITGQEMGPHENTEDSLIKEIDRLTLLYPNGTPKDIKILAERNLGRRPNPNARDDKKPVGANRGGVNQFNRTPNRSTVAKEQFRFNKLMELEFSQIPAYGKALDEHPTMLQLMKEFKEPQTKENIEKKIKIQGLFTSMYGNSFKSIADNKNFPFGADTAKNLMSVGLISPFTNVQHNRRLNSIYSNRVLPIEPDGRLRVITNFIKQRKAASLIDSKTLSPETVVDIRNKIQELKKGGAVADPKGFASGGHVGDVSSSHKESAKLNGFIPRGTDTVPAMLSAGEFVIKKSSVDKYGANNLGAINKGTMNLANGGSVGGSVSGGSGGSSVDMTPFMESSRKLTDAINALSGGFGSFTESVGSFNASVGQFGEFANIFAQGAAMIPQNIFMQTENQVLVDMMNMTPAANAIAASLMPLIQQEVVNTINAMNMSNPSYIAQNSGGS